MDGVSFKIQRILIDIMIFTGSTRVEPMFLRGMSQLLNNKTNLHSHFILLFDI